MQIKLPKCLCIETNTNEREKKNDISGKYEKTGTVDNKLVLYPFGQTKFPNVLIANLMTDKDIETVKGFFGKVVSVTVDMVQTAKGTFYTFEGIEPAKQGA
jgi:hypothetical protein